jgi:hypothetical protein
LKPLKYAKAGFPHFWRVEEDRGRPVVYVYELDRGGRPPEYVATGVHRERLKLSVPYDIDIDLTARR